MTIGRPYFRDGGKLEAERLVMRIEDSIDIGEFAVFRTETNEGSVTTNVSRTFWFPDKATKAGDLVVLYTKAGSNKERPNKNGSTSHFFYWGMSEVLWDSPEFAAVVAHIDEWRSTLTPDEDTIDASLSKTQEL
jgi:hypothetical protein